MAHFWDAWLLLILPIPGGTPHHPLTEQETPRDSPKTAGAPLKPLLIQELTPPLEPQIQPIFQVAYLYGDKNVFLPTRFSCVSCSTCSCGFFRPFLITFSESKDIADGHQTVQNVNYDWVESEHKKISYLDAFFFFPKDHSTYGMLKKCLVFIKAK